MCFLLNLGTLCWQQSSSLQLTLTSLSTFLNVFPPAPDTGTWTENLDPEPGTLPVKLMATTGQSSRVATKFRSFYHNIQRKKAFLC